MSSIYSCLEVEQAHQFILDGVQLVRSAFERPWHADTPALSELLLLGLLKPPVQSRHDSGCSEGKSYRFDSGINKLDHGRGAGHRSSRQQARSITHENIIFARIAVGMVLNQPESGGSAMTLEGAAPVEETLTE